MFKNKKGYIGILLNPLVLTLIIIGGLLLIFSLPNNPFRLAILSNFEFAGFTFQENIIPYSSQCGSGSGSVVREGEFIILKNSYSACTGSSSVSITTDVTGVDELLVIADANMYASAGANSGVGSGFSASIKGSEGGSVGSGFALGIGTNEGGATRSQYFSPRVIKLKNNFDGTWSNLESLNVGDIFIVKQKSAIKGNAILDIEVNGGGSGENGGSTTIIATVYNIVRKENAFALCKADKYAYDLNKDGIISPDGSECVALTTIVLNSEEAIKESFNEKIARITKELEAKNAGLTADIEALKQQLDQQQATEQITALQQQISLLESQLATASDKTAIQSQIDALRQQQLDSGNLQDQINALQSELKTTKTILADVQSKDKNVISTIASQEQFERPNKIKEVWDRIWAFIKNIFT